MIGYHFDDIFPTQNALSTSDLRDIPMKIYRRLFDLAFLPALALIVTIASPANAWFWGKDHPNEAQIEAWVQDEIDHVYDIRSINIRSQDLRQGLVEYSESRLEIKLAPREDLYVLDRYLENQVPVIRNTVDSSISHELTIYAIAEAVPTGEAWDGQVRLDSAAKTLLRDNGNARHIYGPNALVADSPDYHAYIERIEEETRAAEARAQQERLDRAAKVSGVFAGTMACGDKIYEIQKLEVDATNGTGELVHRLARYGEIFGSEPLEVMDRPYDENFSVNMLASKASFELRPGTNAPVLVNRGCSATIYPRDDVPQSVLEQRQKVERFMAAIGQGNVTPTLSNGGTERPARAEVLAVAENGFSIRLDHPRYSNGRFNNSDENRQLSIINVQFVDSPELLVVSGSVEGRGSQIFGGYCTKGFILTPDNQLVLQHTSGYGCGARLILTP